MMNKQPPSKHRAIRSYVLRQGRITPGQQKAIDNYWRKYGIAFSNQHLDFTTIFTNKNAVYLEIGFGMGQSLLTMAKSSPNTNFIGVEVHLPGVGRLLSEIVKNDINNIRIINHDAIDVLEKMIPDNSLEGINIFFPDPWKKKRHHKRRLIQPSFLNLVYQKLQLNGLLHLATDWENYAQHMLECLTSHPGFENTFASDFAPSEHQRPSTKFQKRGEAKGHGVWDLIFTKKT